MTHHTHQPGRARNELAGSWVFAILSVLFTIAIFVASEGLEAAIQFLVPSMFVCSVGAVWLGLSARRHGLENGAVPASVGAVIGGFFAAMLVLGLVGHLIGFE